MGRRALVTMACRIHGAQKRVEIVGDERRGGCGRSRSPNPCADVSGNEYYGDEKEGKTFK